MFRLLYQLIDRHHRSLDVLAAPGPRCIMKIRNESTFAPRGLVRHMERGLDKSGRPTGHLVYPVAGRSTKTHRQVAALAKDLKKRYLYINGLYVGRYMHEPAHINL
jgi:hypothetical protein